MDTTHQIAKIETE